MRKFLHRWFVAYVSLVALILGLVVIGAGAVGILLSLAILVDDLYPWAWKIGALCFLAACGATWIALDD